MAVALDGSWPLRGLLDKPMEEPRWLPARVPGSFLDGDVVDLLPGETRRVDFDGTVEGWNVRG